MKSIIGILIILLNFIAFSCHTQNHEINFTTVPWITLTESISFYCHKKTETPLNEADSIIIEFIGELDYNNNFHKSKNEIPNISFPLEDTLKMYNLSPIWNKLTNNSETYARIDFSLRNSIMVESYSEISILVNEKYSSQINSLLVFLEEKKYSKSAVIISEKEAGHELNDEVGYDIISKLGFNPLPSMIKLKIKNEYLNSNSFENIKQELEKDYRIKNISMKDIGYLEKHLNERIKVIRVKTNC